MTLIYPFQKVPEAPNTFSDAASVATFPRLFLARVFLREENVAEADFGRWGGTLSE